MAAQFLPAAFASSPGARVVCLTVVFLTLAEGYALAGKAVLRRLTRSPRGRRFLPAVCGAGLGLWVGVIWLIFS